MGTSSCDLKKTGSVHRKLFSEGFDPVEFETACSEVEFPTGSEILNMADKMAADV